MRRKHFYNFRSHKSLKFKIKIIVIGIIAAAGVYILFPHFFRNTYIVTIASKQVKKQNSSTYYLIYTQMENGETRTFKNTNSLLELKFNSEDIYGGLRINRKYEISAYGFRIPLLSSYENIVKTRAIK
ncbi:DUF1523 domain-containing protein [Clostridium sp. HV4-5-A1G]|uniref:DUF1523 domain-containing protein n=1 Tax=Clostridium sp. HV4-5-A1G TaxID=2004595 RepID=UPI00123BE3AD|nr:DUF1523 domain-containing protein [Clostridium sp. HV4-5-A1G]KAA8667428.1 DUF1523 domain-containing protein [Clostridium sp. HV4-5-A1G]